jgi:hypothetical protein
VVVLSALACLPILVWRGLTANLALTVPAILLGLTLLGWGPEERLRFRAFPLTWLALPGLSLCLGLTVEAAYRLLTGSIRQSPPFPDGRLEHFLSAFFAAVFLFDLFVLAALISAAIYHAPELTLPRLLFTQAGALLRLGAYVVAGLGLAWLTNLALLRRSRRPLAPVIS